MATDSTLRALVDLRDRTLQKSRIAFGLRVGALDRGADDASPDAQALFARWEERFNDLEKEADKDIAAMVKGVPIVEHLRELKGIGPLLAAKVVSMIDIERADTVSALWRYAGYGVLDGARERPTKGEKLHYNIRLKTTCYLVATSFMRCGSPYRAIYDTAREYYAANRPDWTKGHQHLAATRKMTKVWLSHLWERWRMLEGLPTRELYVIEQRGHDPAHYRRPEEFGWPTL